MEPLRFVYFGSRHLAVMGLGIVRMTFLRTNSPSDRYEEFFKGQTRKEVLKLDRAKIPEEKTFNNIGIQYLNKFHFKLNIGNRIQLSLQNILKRMSTFCGYKKWINFNYLFYFFAFTNANQTLQNTG